MANIEHSTITDPYIHEPKGAASAVAKEVLTAVGDGTSEFRALVLADVSDNGTAHAALTDPYLHESKGVAAAAAGTVSFADGAGSASHRLIDISDISAIDPDAAADGDILVADGAGSAAWEEPPYTALARVDLVSSTQTVALTAGGAHTSASYVDVTQYFSPGLALGGFTYDVTNHAIVPTDGYYRITGWISMSQSEATTPTLAFDVNVNGVAGLVSAPVALLSHKDAGNISTVTGFGMTFLSAGDAIGVSIASDKDTTATIYEGVLDINRFRD
jgi:hypothetical protein